MSIAPVHRTRRNKEDSARYKFRLTQTRGFLPLWLALIILIILQETIFSTDQVEAARELDRVQVKGWTEVNKKWPLEQGEFYVALEKGHHFIEVKLPKKLHNDLDVRLEYYYDYQKVRPVFQMVPCSTNVDIIKNDELDSQRASMIDPDRYTRPSSQPAATWLTHETRVQKSDCERRNELTYNVLLHDANDVFAWRVMEIKSVPQTDPPVSVVTTPAAPTDFSDDNLIQNPASTTQTSQMRDTTTQVTETTAAPTTGSPESSPLVTSEDPNDESIDDVGHQFTKKPGEEVHYNPTTVAPQPSDNEVEVETTTEGPQWPRLKRFALFKEEQDGADETSVSLICRPSSCDRSLFHHPRFMPLVHGVPKLPRDNLLDKKYRYFLNTKNNELEFLQETSEDLADVNLCIDLDLYMDPGTEIEFQIEDNSSQTKTKLLELIQRKEQDIGAGGGGTSLAAAATNGKWEKFKRCASDYMPKLKPVDPAGHSIKLKFVPRVPAVAGKQVALLADPERSISLNRLYPTKDYLPNAVTLPAAEVVDTYWVLDKDGKRKPKLKLESRIPDESTSSDAGPKRALQISNIDPKQESFDITSRWLKVTDLETLENPIHFYYKADRADWVKGVEFQFQKANYGSDIWNTRELYVEFNPIEQDLNIKFIADLSNKPKETLTNPKNLNHRYGELSPNTTTTTASSTTTTSITTTTTSTTTVAPITADAITTTTTVAPITPDDTTTAVVPITTTTGAPVTHLAGQISIPVELKGLDADEFRIRIRHHIKEEAQLANSYLKLNVLQLAFADACAEPNFCLNGGTCKPTGTATAKCTCLPGYSGEHCEKVKPCEVLYGGQTGEQLCGSIGAKCQQNLPVLRCIWPNDQYYECRALFETANNNGDSTQVLPVMSSAEYEERLNDQTRTIIILSVFMGALLLFSVVIIGNMVGRLMESRKRLSRAEHEAHELVRRSHPGGSGAARLRGRQKPATVSYNNQAFDTE